MCRYLSARSHDRVEGDHIRRGPPRRHLLQNSDRPLPLPAPPTGRDDRVVRRRPWLKAALAHLVQRHDALPPPPHPSAPGERSLEHPFGPLHALQKNTKIVQSESLSSAGVRPPDWPTLYRAPALSRELRKLEGFLSLSRDFTGTIPSSGSFVFNRHY